MTPNGEFVAPAGPGRSRTPRGQANWPLRLGLGAAAVAAVAGTLALAAVFLWLATVLVPIALIAGLVAFAALKFQAWRLRH